MKRLPGNLLALLLLSALAAHTFRAHNLLTASRTLRTVEAVTQGLAASGRIRTDVLWRHVRVLEQAERDLDPGSVALPLARGAQYLLLKRPREAIVAYERALTLEIRPEIYLNLGRAQVLAGDRRAARECFETVRKLDPLLARRLPPDFDPEPTPGKRSKR